MQFVGEDGDFSVGVEAEDAVGLGAAIVHGPKHVLGATLDTNTLLYAGTAVIVGFQAIVFGVLTRVYGMVSGFLPPKRIVERFTQQGTLEIGLIAGIALFAVGVGSAIYATLQWRATGFAGLEYTRILRVVIPSAIAIILGLQIMLGAFFLSVLMINRKP